MNHPRRGRLSIYRGLQPPSSSSVRPAGFTGGAKSVTETFIDAMSAAAGLGGSVGARSGARREDARSLGTALTDEDSVVEVSESDFFVEPSPLAPFIQPKMPREPRRRWWSLDERAVAKWDSVKDWASGRGAVPLSAYVGREALKSVGMERKSFGPDPDRKSSSLRVVVAALVGLVGLCVCRLFRTIGAGAPSSPSMSGAGPS